MALHDGKNKCSAEKGVERDFLMTKEKKNDHSRGNDAPDPSPASQIGNERSDNAAADKSTKVDSDDSSLARVIPDLARRSQPNEWPPATTRQGSWSAAPQHSPSPSSLDVPLDVPLSYQQHRPQQPDYLPVTDGWLFRGVKTRVGDLALADIVAAASDVAARRMGRSEVLCEYTWIETGGAGGAAWPALYVPGCMPIWRGVLRGCNLKQAKRALSVRDEHAQRQPLFPYEPTFRALEEAQAQAQARVPGIAGQPIHEPIKFRAVEVVSDAETLAQIFTFISCSYPSKAAPFRLELSTVRNTLFVSKAEHPHRGHTAKRGRVLTTMPDWTSDAVLSLGTRGARVSSSGGHWRLMRYRLGTMVCVVRAKVDFMYGNRQKAGGTIADPLKRFKHEMVKGNKEQGGIKTWKTSIKHVGHGTRGGAPGLVALRYRSEDAKGKLARSMPVIWFGRVPFVVDAAVSPKLEVMDVNLLYVRAKYARWEKQHQASLKRMAGLLERLKHVARALGGSCVVVADPIQGCFTVMKPVIKRTPVPEELILRFWGEDDGLVETEYESSVASAVSELSSLSRTPSGFEDWTLESPREESNKKRPNPDSHCRPFKRPRTDSTGLVRGWLNRRTDDPGHQPYGQEGKHDSEDPSQTRPHNAISRRGFSLGDGSSGSRLGHDGTIEYECNINMRDGGNEEDEESFEEDEESGEESVSDWAEDGV